MARRTTFLALRLMRAMVILGDIVKVVHPSEGSFDLSSYDNVVGAIIGIIWAVVALSAP